MDHNLFCDKKNWIRCLSSSFWKPSSHFLARKPKKIWKCATIELSSSIINYLPWLWPPYDLCHADVDVASSSSVHCGLSKSLETSAGLWTTKPGWSSIHHRIMGFPWDFHRISIGFPCGQLLGEFRIFKPGHIFTQWDHGRFSQKSLGTWEPWNQKKRKTTGWDFFRSLTTTLSLFHDEVMN